MARAKCLSRSPSIYLNLLSDFHLINKTPISARFSTVIMAPRCTPEQMAIIDEEYERYVLQKRIGAKTRSTIQAATKTIDFGLMITSQEIGKSVFPSYHDPQIRIPKLTFYLFNRYYATRYAAEHGKPRAVRKTPSQIARLQASFEKDAYPTVGEQILIVYETGLEPKQVKSSLTG